MRISGKVEVFTPWVIKGWLAIYGDNTDESPRIEVLLDGTPVASVIAKDYREDIASKGLGDGNCQYQITLPKALNADEMKRLKMRISGSEVFLELPRPFLDSSSKTAAAVSSCISPVFIVGSPRSGTSVLVRALSSAGFHGFHEGNFLGLSGVIDQNIDGYLAGYEINDPGTLLGNVNLADLKARLFLVFKEISDKMNPKEPWFDKTGNPEMVRALPRIMEAWNNSRVIFTKRHGVENVVSRLVKFPSRDFTYHCQDWAKNMRAWRLTRTRLDPSRIVEIDQKDILERPDAIALKLSEFLGLSQQKQEKIENVFRTERPEESFPGSAAKKLRIKDTGWDNGQIGIFEKICKEEMDIFGYQFDE